MKRINIIRIFGIALIVAILCAAMPILPVFAFNDIILSSSSGTVGQSITVHGTNFGAGPTERYATIYFSPINVSIGTALASLTTYEFVGSAPITTTTQNATDAGNFTKIIAVPSTMTWGAIDQNVTAGQYYLYVTIDLQGNPGTAISSKASFTVTTGGTLDTPSPASGPPGTSVVITGSDFPASTPIVFQFDSTVITPTSGHTSTLSSGLFLTTITIPTSATVGAHTITVTVGSSTRSTTFTVTATAALGALQPSSGAPGTLVAISGTNFPASTAIVFKFDTTVLTPTGSTQTGPAGSFASIITIPSTATAGVHTITVTVGTIARSANFTVTGTATTTPPPTTTTTPPTTTTTPPTTSLPISIDQTGDSIGDSVYIGGSGFIPNSAVTVTFDGTAVAQGTTTESGFVVVSFEIPPSQHGEHTIVVSDGTNNVTTTFTVESIAPAAPLPRSPATGEAIDFTALFDWDDVTDNSTPVTYNFQVATDPNFTPESIVLNKTGLTKSEYTFTEIDQTNLSSEATYYWREQAVDAALNESPWVIIGDFSIVKPFEFIGWPLYLTIGIGGLILFLLGLWVGRRTAFYY